MINEESEIHIAGVLHVHKGVRGTSPPLMGLGGGGEEQIHLQ